MASEAKSTAQSAQSTAEWAGQLAYDASENLANIDLANFMSNPHSGSATYTSLLRADYYGSAGIPAIHVTGIIESQHLYLLIAYPRYGGETFSFLLSTYSGYTGGERQYVGGFSGVKIDESTKVIRPRVYHFAEESYDLLVFESQDGTDETYNIFNVKDYYLNIYKLA
jgi:hypothetical protein